MVIKKQPIISWLLEDITQPKNFIYVKIPSINNHIHLKYLSDGLYSLGRFRNIQPNWGIPELPMPSFQEAMWKSAKNFPNYYYKLFQEFCKNKVSGILLHKDVGTIIYTFNKGTLFIWMFRNIDKYSVIRDHFRVTFTQDNKSCIINMPSMMDDPQIYLNPDKETREKWYPHISTFLMIYLAVKKYAKVETIIVPSTEKVIVENEINGYTQKEKVKNDSGQEVKIMDSRWFVKIINDNDISVRGFFRMQRYKNEKGD